MEEFKYLIPEESGIVVSMDVEKLREVEGNLRDVFTRHQYKELILPMFEYVDLFKTTRHQKEESMFQFMNRDGKRIALRADFTVPIARLYHNENTDEVRRYCYFGEVFRMQELSFFSLITSKVTDGRDHIAHKFNGFFNSSCQ